MTKKGRRKATFEHKKNVYQGGTHELKNLVIACLYCNLARGGKSRYQFIKWLMANNRGARQRLSTYHRLL